MFTGIIEEKGIIVNIERGIHFSRISIKCKKILSDLNIGDSVAVNGVCLTATKVEAYGFTADIMHETLKASSLFSLKSRDHVNLERAVAPSGRLGGHMVSGHIDGIGKIVSIQNDSIAKLITIEVPEHLTRYMVYKGSVAIDGISLTLSSVEKRTFGVSVIPHTMSETTLISKRIGDVVNIETDIVGRYIEKFMGISTEKDNNGIPHGATASNTLRSQTSDRSASHTNNISIDFLTKNGF